MGEFEMEYLSRVYYKYNKSNKSEKKKVLDDLVEVCKYNRKYAIRLLNGIPPEDRKLPEYKRERKFKYLKQTINILGKIWESAGYLWSERLKAVLPLWIPWVKNITPLHLK